MGKGGKQGGYENVEVAECRKGGSSVICTWIGVMGREKIAIAVQVRLAVLKEESRGRFECWFPNHIEIVFVVNTWIFVRNFPFGRKSAAIIRS